MFVIRIIKLTIAFNHSYHTCKFDIDWISILLKISKINANFDFIAACSSSPSLLLLPFASCSLRNLALNHSIIIEISRKIAFGTTWVWRGLGSMNKGPNATIRLVRRQNHAGTTVSWTTVQREKNSHAYKLSSNVQTACSTDSLNNCPKHSILRFSSFALKIYLWLKMCQHNLPCSIVLPTACFPEGPSPHFTFCSFWRRRPRLEAVKVQCNDIFDKYGANIDSQIKNFAIPTQWLEI